MSKIDELEGRLSLVEERLGIDAEAIEADSAAALERGAAQNEMTEAVLEGAGGQTLDGEEPANPEAGSGGSQ